MHAYKLENEDLKRSLQENLTESEQYNILMNEEITNLNTEIKNKQADALKAA